MFLGWVKRGLYIGDLDLFEGHTTTLKCQIFTKIEFQHFFYWIEQCILAKLYILFSCDTTKS